MEKDIFFTQFDRTPQDTGFYSAVGRSLAFATRFESNCRVIVGVIGLTQGSRPMLDSEEEVGEFVNRIMSSTLSRNIHKLTKSAEEEDEIRNTLNAAREARNYIAHHVTQGFETVLPDGTGAGETLAELRKHVRNIAEADRFVCLLISLFTRKPLPSGSFINGYPDAVVDWVFADVANGP
jgi:hypothetical protein